MRRAALLLVALALTLTGCETTAEKSAKLEHEAKELAAHRPPPPKGLSIVRESTAVKVVDATVLHSSEGAAAVVTVRNTSSRTLRAVPIAITVKDAAGSTLYQNNLPGLETALVSIAALAPHAELTWIDDQLPASGAPATVSARLGEVAAAGGSLPDIALAGLHVSESSSNGVGAAGTVSNRSGVTQHKLVVFALARRAGRIVAAGRAVLPEVGAGASVPFEVFFIGEPRGAQLQASAPPTSG
ncbi:MAG TPA: hypothetical protein VKG38_02875 [Solirubrobacteraceae bacterium]|nr:hypothetical protein [Solirubrobacteraceae bacterium]